MTKTSPQTGQITEREQIRQIWRPLYDLGYKGHEQIDAQYMAMLISQAVTETQALLVASNRELLERLYDFKNKESIKPGRGLDEISFWVGFDCMRDIIEEELKPLRGKK